MLRPLMGVTALLMIMEMNVYIATDWWWGARDPFGPYPRIPDKNLVKDGMKEDHGHSPGDRIWNNFRGKYFRISLLESLDYLPLRQLIPIRKPSFLPLAQRAPFGYGTLIAKTRNERSVRTDHGGYIGSSERLYKYKLVFAFSDRFYQPDLTASLIIN
ncbi:hypothetical protein ALC60_00700 [Trachymyrmex zeteki]|uniref:Uncharacterized protein n=1 Tax=Mycetomoellerius zeteki TaxID=64791 RepID=A0A151XIQ4_9HYME|nr:hypothetical protein ALC60_00700 [Trachymyrmex zeteki]